MAYAEKKRGNLWRARWVSPSGKLESQSGFKTRKAAEDYANDQESSVRKNTYVDVRAGQVTVAEIANAWYSGLDLEPTTMSNYRYMTEVYILPEFGERAVGSLTEHEMPIWERKLVTGGLSRARPGTHGRRSRRSSRARSRDTSRSTRRRGRRALGERGRAG